MARSYLGRPYIFYMYPATQQQSTNLVDYPLVQLTFVASVNAALGSTLLLMFAA